MDLLNKIIKCIYNLQKTDIDILNAVMNAEKPITHEEISKRLNISKTSINKSLNKLVLLDIVKRSKILTRKIGRPVYEYWVDKEELLNRIRKELESILST